MRDTRGRSGTHVPTLLLRCFKCVRIQVRDLCNIQRTELQEDRLEDGMFSYLFSRKTTDEGNV